MQDEVAKRHGWMTDKELEEMDQRIKKTEEEGLKNALKHFDRIHDKLFSFNNIMIAGYFALAKIVNEISDFLVLIPIANLIVLLWIEYSMLQKSRFEASIASQTPIAIKKWGKSIEKTNLISLLSILSTSIVTIIFLRYLLFR